VSSVNTVKLFFEAYSAMVWSFAPFRLVSETVVMLKPVFLSHSVTLFGMFSSANIFGKFCVLF